MKVLMFGWEFPPHNSGGLGVACHGLTKALSNQGAEIVFVLPKKIKIEKTFFKIPFIFSSSQSIFLCSFLFLLWHENNLRIILFNSDYFILYFL